MAQLRTVAGADEGAGLVLLGQAEGETADGLGDVEGLDVVVVVVFLKKTCLVQCQVKVHGLKSVYQ